MMGRLVVAVLLVATSAFAADSGELERLRAENARLTEKVKQLEAENAKLRGDAQNPLAAALEERARETVSVEVDEGDDTTTVTTEASRLERDGGGARHWITFRAEKSNGSAAVRPELIIATSASQGQYRDVRQLDLIVDGQPVACDVVKYRSQPNTSVRGSARPSEEETVTAALSMSSLDRLAQASSVKGTLGGTAFQLTPEQLAALRAFRQKL
jgi:cell division protein FtsB